MKSKVLSVRSFTRAITSVSIYYTVKTQSDSLIKASLVT